MSEADRAAGAEYARTKFVKLGGAVRLFRVHEVTKRGNLFLEPDEPA